MGEETEAPWREFLSLDEYIKVCKEFLNDCFETDGKIKVRNNFLNLETNIRAALDVLDDMEDSDWVDTSQLEEE